MRLTRLERRPARRSDWPPFETKTGMDTIRGIPGWGPAQPILSIGGYGGTGDVWTVPLGSGLVENGTTPYERARAQVQARVVHIPNAALSGTMCRVPPIQ